MSKLKFNSIIEYNNGFGEELGAVRDEFVNGW
jgi:hypothetical protein